MELTGLDKQLLDGLQVLTDQEISRVQAHLAAGLPMRLHFGYTADLGPACFGCLVGTAMSEAEYDARHQWEGVQTLAMSIFLTWARERPEFRTHRALPMTAQLNVPLPQQTLDRLAALLDIEWSRRHPRPAVVPTEPVKEAVPA
jgi:hypothetical protein